MTLPFHDADRCPSSMVPDRTFPSWVFQNRIRRVLRDPAAVLEPDGPRAGETLADLGAGGGFFLSESRRRVGPKGRIYVIDVDAAALARARRSAATAPGTAEITYLHRSAASVPEIPDGSVDFAISNGLLCCMVDKEGAMDELWRILRPGGRALVRFVECPLHLPGRRQRALRVTARHWQELVHRRPWMVEENPHGVRRQYRLTKPEPWSNGSGR